MRNPKGTKREHRLFRVFMKRVTELPTPDVDIIDVYRAALNAERAKLHRYATPLATGGYLFTLENWEKTKWLS